MSGGTHLVLTYHSISNGAKPLCVSPHRLADDLDFLQTVGFRAVSLNTLIDVMSSGERPAAGQGGSLLSVTFDDGYQDFVDSALPVLEERGVPGTVFVAASASRDTLSGGIQGKKLLSLDRLGELVNRGVTIGAHGVSHSALTKLDDSMLEVELFESKRVLTTTSGQSVDFFAYPFGDFDDRVRDAASRHYAASFSTQLASLPEAADLSCLPRVDAYYLGSPVFRALLARGIAAPYLVARRGLRMIRGSEPRTRLPRRRGSCAKAAHPSSKEGSRCRS